MKKSTYKYVLLLVAAVLCAPANAVSPATPQPSVASNTLRLAFASTAGDTGLPKWLVEDFRQLYPDIEVEVSSVGALEALDRARRGEADLVITHHQPSEALFVVEGWGTSRNIFMYNEFAFFGPPSKNFNPHGETDIRVLIRKLATAEVPFYAPASRSGTALKLGELWSIAGVQPNWIGYEVSGGSARSTLSTAAQFESYAFADIGTYLAMRNEIKGRLQPLIRDHISLRNYYAVLPVSAKKVPGAHQGIAETFRDYLLSERGQQRIGAFSVAEFNVNLFIPAAHMDDSLRTLRAEEKLRNKARFLDITILLFVVVAVSALVAFVLWRRFERSESKRKESEERFSIAVEGANDGIWDWDVTGNKLYVSPKFREIMHIEGSADWMHDPLGVLVRSVVLLDRVRVQRTLEEAITCAGTGRFAIETMVDNNDKPVWVLISGKAHKILNGKPTRVTGAVSNITAQRERDEFQHQSMHDALTGLPNRVLFQDRLNQMILALQREENSGTVMMVDLNGFKAINDINGHHMGDLLLIEVTRRMKESIRSSDTIARLGGDEFAILLPKADATVASEIAKKLTSSIEESITIDGKSLYVTASVGLSVYPQHATDAEKLLKHADSAMYVAKRMKKRVFVYSSAAV